MSELNSIITLEYHKKRYTVGYILTNVKNPNIIIKSDTTKDKTRIPILLDRHIYKIVRSLNKQWYLNDRGNIYCHHVSNNEIVHINLHEIVMRISEGEKNYIGTRQVSIIHINNIHYDNRIENLKYDTVDKDCIKNMKKKKRTADLTEFDIDVNELPTYLWYMKGDRSHGDRFIIEIPNVLTWRSTSSKTVSLRYKLEEAKKYMRYIRKYYPDVFGMFSMNGDLSILGKRLYNDYRVMIAKAKFIIDPPSNNTEKFLIPNITNMSPFEKFLLESFNPRKGAIDVNDYKKLFD